jgi:hypothetical protein
MAIAPAFNLHEVELIFQSLPDEVDQRRLKLLPKILREWAKTDLPPKLLTEPAKTRQQRLKLLKAISNYATKLSQALNTAKCSDDQFLIILEMIKADERRLGLTERQAERGNLANQFQGMRTFLRKISAAATTSEKTWKRSPGQPTKIVARQVLMDIIAIYEWLTGRKATRQVDRTSGKETGPFWSFAVTIWPMVFGTGKESLSATLKGWDHAVKHGLTGTRSALIENIAVRRPKWRVLTIRPST